MDTLTFYYVVFSPLTAQAVLISGGLSLALAAAFLVLFSRQPAASRLSRFAPTPLGRGLAAVQGWALSLRGAQRLLPAVILYALACTAYAWDAPETPADQAGVREVVQQETTPAPRESGPEMPVWRTASVYSLSLVAFFLALSSFLWGPGIDEALRQIGRKRGEPGASPGSLSEQVSALRGLEGRPAPPGLFPLLYQAMVARLQNLRLRTELPWRWRTLLVNGLQAACLVALSYMLFERAGSFLAEAVEPFLHPPGQAGKREVAPSFPPEAPRQPEPAEKRAERSAGSSGPEQSAPSKADRRQPGDSRSQAQAGQAARQEPPGSETPPSEPHAGPAGQEPPTGAKSTPSTGQPTAGAEDQAAPQEPPSQEKPAGSPSRTCSSPSCSAGKPCQSCAGSTGGASGRPEASQGGQKSQTGASPGSAGPSQTPEEPAEKGGTAAPAFEPGKEPGRTPVPGVPGSARDDGTKRPGEDPRMASTPPQDPNKGWGTGIGPPVEGAPRPATGDRGTQYEEMRLPGRPQGPESLAASDFDPEAKTPSRISDSSRPTDAARHNPTTELRPNRYVEPLPLSPQRVPPEYRAAFHKLFKRNE